MRLGTHHVNEAEVGREGGERGVIKEGRWRRRFLSSVVGKSYSEKKVDSDSDSETENESIGDFGRSE